MVLDSANVDIAVSGMIAYATVGSAVPTNATSSLDAAYLDVGYISSDGVEEARERSTSNVVAWQHADVVRTVVTESSITVAFTMIETNRASVELYYGAPVADDGSVEIVPSRTGGRKATVIDYIDGDKFVRMFLPQSEVTEVGSSTLASADAVGYNVTLTGYPDGSLGYSAKKWFSALVIEASTG